VVGSSIVMRYPIKKNICRSGHYMYLQFLTFINSVFMRFAWILEQTAIISLYSINGLVFITDTECLLRGRTGSLNIIHVFINLSIACL